MVGSYMGCSVMAEPSGAVVLVSFMIHSVYGVYGSVQSTSVGTPSPLPAHAILQLRLEPLNSEEDRLSGATRGALELDETHTVPKLGPQNRLHAHFNVRKSRVVNDDEDVVAPEIQLVGKPEEHLLAQDAHERLGAHRIPVWSTRRQPEEGACERGAT